MPAGSGFGPVSAGGAAAGALVPAAAVFVSCAKAYRETDASRSKAASEATIFFVIGFG
jgi:hypothetical protein